MQSMWIALATARQPMVEEAWPPLVVSKVAMVAVDVTQTAASSTANATAARTGRQTALRDALAAASAISDDSSRVHALTALAPHLPQTERQTALRDALAAASAISDIRPALTP